jgi:uncharacterized protein YbjT (DUF2867 family)
MARIVVIGGTGLIGEKVLSLLLARGHDAFAASPTTGVDVGSGEGLDEALVGASVVVDVSKPRTYDPDDVWRYFEAAAANVTAAERRAGVAHHIALSAVGTDHDPQPIPFYRAKAHGEEVLRASGQPYSIVRATQFFEFGAQIGAQAAEQETDDARVADALVQPIAGDDVAGVLAHLADRPPANGATEIAGPDVMPLAEFVGRALRAAGDSRTVVADPEARYFGGVIDERELLPRPGAWLAPTRFDAWLAARSAR